MKIVMIGSSLEQNGGIATVEKLILKHVFKDIEIQHITSHDEGTIIHRVIVFAKCLGAFLTRLLFQPTDVVYIHISDRGSLLRKTIIAIMAFAFGKPVVMHTHGGPFPVTYAGLPQWAQNYLKWVFGKCSAFIVLSDSWKDFYVNTCELDPNRVFVLINPTEIPPEIPQRSLKEGKVTLFFCGRISQQKGAFDLIQAFAQLPSEQKDNSRLIIAGDAGIEAGKKLVESLNLTSYVTFPGWIDSEQRDKLLADSDLFMLPSYHEGLPMAILEAMSWGLPIITTPVGGIPEVVIEKQNGLLITPGNVQQLSQAMQSLIQNKNLRLSLGKAARETATHFDVSSYSCHLSDILNSVI